MIRVVSLDAGNTLFTERESRASIYAATAAGLGLEVRESDCREAMARCHDRLPRRVEGAFRYTGPWFRAFIQEVFAELGHPRPPAALQGRLFERFADPGTFRLFEDVPDTLEELARQGVRLAVISNWAPHLTDILTGLGIRDRFDQVLVSSVEELEKPDARLFHRAERLLGASSAECVHVGDHPLHDREGARAAGWRALWLDRTGQERVENAIHSLREIPYLCTNFS